MKKATNRLKSVKYFNIFLAVIFLVACKDRYDPKIKSNGAHFLVVEGFINTQGETNFHLSRTRNITWGDTASFINEDNARVNIEDNSNNIYPLSPLGGGNYSGSFFLSSTNLYRLHIVTSDNKEYVSDFVPCKVSPPINKVSWEFNNGSVWINVNTGDPSGNTHFYRWSFAETWEFHSQYNSYVKYNAPDTTVIPRTTPVNVCYRDASSTSILIASSAKLSSDVIDKATVQMIPPHDKRISVLYSILVTQYALDSAGYNFWNAMKSNTEEVGSIFGMQPNQTPGNLHCLTDSSEQVIGYVGAGATEQQRLFISNSSMPADWNQLPNCIEYEVPNIKDSLLFYFTNNMLVPYLKDSTAQGMRGYLSASGTCVDCTLTGSPVKPSFWP